MTSLRENERYSRLLSWSRDEGGALHQSVEIYSDDVTRVSLRCRPSYGDGTCQPESVSSGDSIVVCPLSTSLSYLNILTGGRPLVAALTEDTEAETGKTEAATSAPKPLPPLSALAGTYVFPEEFVIKTPPHVLGRLFLVQQYLLGEASPWFAYIATLPQPEHVYSWSLPVVWPQRSKFASGAGNNDDNGNRPGGALAWLAGTNAERGAEDMRMRMDREYSSARRCLKRLGYRPYRSFSRLLYNWAYCIFTSRSFRPSLVLSSDLQQALTGSSSDDEEAKSFVAAILPKLPDGCAIDDFSILLPVLDLANHDPQAAVAWKTSDTAVPPLLPTPSASAVAALLGAVMPSLRPGVGVAGTAIRTAAVTFCTMQPYGPGAQVFNNYGMKTNSELLLGYGFILPPTDALHNDYIHLRMVIASRSEKDPGEDDDDNDDDDDDDDGDDISTDRTDRPLPRDFLLSLRPMTHLSSVVGRSRQWTSPSHLAPPIANAVRLYGLELFDDALLWDICKQLPQQQEVSGEASEVGGAITPAEKSRWLDLILAAPAKAIVPKVPESHTLAGLVRAMLRDKVTQDYGRILETDAYMEEDSDGRDDEDDGGGHPRCPDYGIIQLAKQYREQYRAVLQHALQRLGDAEDSPAGELQ